MNAENFCYWLMGYFELHGAVGMGADQTKCVKRHLDLVFVHDLDPRAVTEKLQEIHDGPPKEELPPIGEPYHDAPPIGGGDIKYRC